MDSNNYTYVQTHLSLTLLKKHLNFCHMGIYFLAMVYNALYQTRNPLLVVPYDLYMYCVW